MDQQIRGSNLRLVRIVIGCSEENVETAPGATIGGLFQLLAAKHTAIASSKKSLEGVTI
jgi:hypothetical protein